MRLSSLIKNDIVLQFRHGFYFAYFIVSMIYIIVLKFIPETHMDLFTAFIIFTDPSIFGFFFIGAIMLLDRAQNTLEGLFVSPVRIHEYFCAKIISLTLIAQASSFVITLVTYGFSFNHPALFIGIFLTSALFILLGLGLSTFAKSFNSFILMSILYISVLFVPLLAYFQLFDSFIFYLFPTTASLILIESAFASTSILEQVYAWAMLLLSIIAVYAWAYKLFQKHIIYKIGADR